MVDKQKFTSWRINCLIRPRQQSGDWIWVLRDSAWGFQVRNGIRENAQLGRAVAPWPHGCMDATEQHASIIAQRMAEVRELVGVPVDVLADRSSVEAGLLESIEKGRRYPTLCEVASVSGAAGLPVGWFLEEPEQLVTSRRTALDGGVSPDFDLALEALAFRIRKLRNQRIVSVDGGQPFAMSQSHDDTKKAVEKARATARAGLEPIRDLTTFREKLGLLAFSRNFVGSPFEGAVTEIQ